MRTQALSSYFDHRPVGLQERGIVMYVVMTIVTMRTIAPAVVQARASKAMAEECLFEINERTSFPLNVQFLDEDAQLVVPTSATYRIDDEVNRTNILPATAFPSLSTSVDLWITSDQNFIIRPRSKYEVRTVTVQYVYNSVNGPTPATSQYKYKVLNLYGVVDVPSASLSPSASASPSV